MKLTLDTADSRFTVQSYERGRVMVNDAVIDYPVIIDGEGYRRWPLDDIGDGDGHGGGHGDTLVAALAWRHFTEPLSRKPEILILGTGAAYRMPDARIMVGMAAAKVGFEAMDTAAACRTYNVLLSEGRKAAAALLMI